MKDLQREILQQVASGAISAEEGAARLESLVDTTAIPEMPAADQKALPAARSVRVSSQFGAAEIVGDPSVDFAVADGPHQVRQEGDAMVIQHQPFGESDAFSFGPAGASFARRLTVRMNPDLPLFASVQAGNVRVDGVHGPITAEVQAGNCSVSDFRGPLSLTVQAGNVSATGRLDSGKSSVRCEMGSVKIYLDRGSNVHIKAYTAMGKFAIDGVSAKLGDREATVGTGEAALNIECAMGNVRVSVL